MKINFGVILRLIQAYSKCSDEASRSKLLANLKYGSQQRLSKCLFFHYFLFNFI